MTHRSASFPRTWLGLALLVGLLALHTVWAAPAPAGATAPIAPAELGARVEEQSPAPAPVLALGVARLDAPLQDLVGRVGPDGLTVSSTSDTEGGGDFTLRPLALEKGDARAAMPAGVVSLDGATAVLERGVLREVFTASADGLRQDFVVAAPPPGQGPLTLTLGVTGATARADGARIALTLPGGRGLVYDRLRVTDADGRAVPGQMRVADPHTLTIAVADAGARYPLTIDPTITDADWTVLGDSIPGASSNVRAMATTATGIYLAGSFTVVSNIDANRIAFWDGSVLTALGSGVDNTVYALAWDSATSRLYVGGAFTTAGGAAANHIAVWNGATSTWSPLLAGASNGVNNSVQALLLDGTDLYVGGNFTDAPGTTSQRLAKCACANLASVTWSAVPSNNSGFDQAVTALAKQGSILYAAGQFAQVRNGGTDVAIRGIAHIDLGAGAPAWAALGAGVAADDAVNALAFDGSGALYATGKFTVMGGVSDTAHIARWTPGVFPGGAWSALGTGLNQTGNALVYRSADASLYVGGSFTMAGGADARRLARWNGSAWGEVAGGVDAPINALALDAAGTALYIGGEPVTTVGSGAAAVPVQNVGRLNLTNSTWSALANGINGIVRASAVKDGSLYIGGEFTGVPGASGSPIQPLLVNHVARWDGSAWSAMDLGLTGRVIALHWAADGTLYAGGAMSATGAGAALTPIHVAKWTGSAWASLGGGSAPTPAVRQVGVSLASSGATLYVSFADVSPTGLPDPGLLYAFDGSAWSKKADLPVVFGFGGGVYAMAIRGSTLYAGGYIPKIGSTAFNGLVQCTLPTCGTWSDVGTGSVGGGVVNALALHGDDLYAGGSFSTAGGVAASNVAKWNGTAWSALGSGLGSSTVDSLAYTGGALYAGGNFTQLGGGGATVNNIAVWDGASWAGLGSGVTSTGRTSIFTLAASGSTLYAGGDFTTAGGKRARYVAAVKLPPPAPATTTLSSTANPSLEGQYVTFRATVMGDYPTGTVTFQADGANLSGCVNVALVAGVAACNTATLTAGSHAIVALYSGDANNGASNGSLTQVVNPATLSVSATAPGGGGYVVCDPSSVAPGGNSTCIATPDLGYQVEAWGGACASWTNNPRCNLFNIQSNAVSTVSFSLLPTYSVAASVLGGYGGTVSCTPTTVIQGGNSSCSAVPAAGYQVGSWGGACAFAGSNAQCTLSNIQADQVSTVSFAPVPPATYTVTATAADPYGTASCLPNAVKAGENSTCYAVPLAGFRVKSWSGACAFAGSNAQCALTNINANQASTVSFELIPPNTYTVSATVVGGNYGSVSCLPATVKAGEDSTCYAVPYAGFRIKSWGGACAAAGSNAQCALTKIQANQTATVSFELIPPATFTVTATVVGGNGNVSCLPTSVIAGNSSTCFAVPYAGFQVQSWGGACAAAGNAAQCGQTNIQTDQTATVSFEPVPLPTYTVSATVASGNGTVDCAPASVTKGDSSHCTAIPDPGWQVTGWTGACAATGANASCFLPKIQKNEVSTVSFGLIPPATYHISARVVLGNGSVSCTPDTVTAGGQSTCTAVPDSGYQVQNWGGACRLAGSNAQCFLSKIKKDQTATVSFALLPPAHYTVSATVVGGNGSVSCTPATVTAGNSSACTAVPDAGFAVQGWTGACAATGSGDLCALANIQADQSSTVRFAALPVPSYTISATAPGGNGTVSCAPSPVPQGGSSACTAVPALGYQVQGWTGDCAATGANVQCALTNILSNQNTTVSFSAIPVNSYHISATVVLGNGSVSCTPTTVTKGGNSSCTALPAPGWQVLDWGGACAGTGANAQCFLPKIRKDEASTVSFALILPATHSVSATVTGGNGNVSCSPATVTKNDASTCLAVPDPGYQVQSWTGACAGAGSNPQCYLTKVQKDAVSTVSFVALPVNHYSVTAAVIGGNGTVSCTPTSVTAGQGSTCTAVPEPGYQVQSWSGACLLAGSAAQCSLTNIQTDQSSTVSFALIPPITYTVTATVASGNGTVSCAPSPVIKGGGSTCTAVPAAGWQVQNWTGACAATGGNVQCFLPKVQKNEVTTVSFIAQPPQTYSVSATVALGLGAVSCTPASVSAGGGSTCTAVPDSGYQVQSWGGACAASGASAQCSLGNITANQVATVSFVASPPASYLVTASVAGGHGSVSCTPASVGVGGSSVCTAVPERGYQVQSWSGACAFAGSNLQCRLTNIQENKVSSVTFIAPTPIPTLSQWGLLLLGALLALVARWRGLLPAGRR